MCTSAASCRCSDHGLRARAKQHRALRRIGVLLPAASNDLEFQLWVGAFLQGLALSGWTIGRNVRIDTRWATSDAAEIRRHAAELVTLAPLGHGHDIETLINGVLSTRACSFFRSQTSCDGLAEPFLHSP